MPHLVCIVVAALLTLVVVGAARPANVRYRLAAETDDEGSDEDDNDNGSKRKRKVVRSAGKEPKSKRSKVDKDD
jgi:hypothetical protein